MTTQTLPTAPEAAQILHVSTARLYSLLRMGAIPCIRLGRQVRISPAALETFITQGGRALQHAGDSAATL
jgi:excisionase family DNA binding protein